MIPRCLAGPQLQSGESRALGRPLSIGGQFRLRHALDVTMLSLDQSRFHDCRLRVD
jgi:hypothetical protein